MSKSKSEDLRPLAHEPDIPENAETLDISFDDVTLRQGDATSQIKDDCNKSSKPTTEQWDPDPAQRQRRLEAVLFLARSPLSSRKLSQLAGLEDGTQARTMIRQLNQRYDTTDYAFHVKQVAGGYQMLTRPQFSKWLRLLEHVPRHAKLSGPAMETLAIVAYRQPIIKADIEAIRGVSSGEMLRQLLEKGLAKISGRSEELGRPYLYSTTNEFLAQFGLGSLDDLPRSDQLSGQGLPTWANSDQISDPNENNTLDAIDSTTTD